MGKYRQIHQSEKCRIFTRCGYCTVEKVIKPVKCQNNRYFHTVVRKNGRLPCFWGRFLSPLRGNHPANQDLDNDVCHKNRKNITNL